jgi:hypothetical protein
MTVHEILLSELIYDVRTVVYNCVHTFYQEHNTKENYMFTVAENVISCAEYEVSSYCLVSD